MNFSFDAYVTEIVADSGRAVFALGEGEIVWEGSEPYAAHDGAILAAAAHPKGGLLTGGDDGRLVWSRADSQAETLADLPGRWIDALAVSPVGGLIAFGAGKEARVLDTGDAKFERRFAHEATVSGLAFDAKGRRLAAATYGGAALWYARLSDQKPVMLRWAGSHVGVAFSPDGKFLVSSMQESALHGWRLSDGRDMRMGGYPSKVRSMVFAGSHWLATSGANGAVLWPFAGANGPMGSRAMEIAWDETALVARVAVSADGRILAGGLSDGRVWVFDMDTEERRELAPARGVAISALTFVGQRRLAWGAEDGAAAIIDPAAP